MTLWLLGIFTSALAFLFGRSWTQSEKIIEEKKAIYAKFLEACPSPRDAYRDGSEMNEVVERIDKLMGLLSLYAAPEVLVACGRYMDELTNASLVLGPSSPALHPAYKKATRMYNAMVLEMRRDILAWSAFRMSKARRELKAVEVDRLRDSL